MIQSLKNINLSIFSESMYALMNTKKLQWRELFNIFSYLKVLITYREQKNQK